ncbi:major facilitator superfamily domain-containing protein [Trichoderma chlorosporum]
MSKITGEDGFTQQERNGNENTDSTITLELRSNKSDPAPDVDAAPDGGTQAWLAAAGAGAIFYCCLGLSNSFGAFEEFYLANQLRDESPDKISWIGSLSAFLQFAMGMLGGPMFDRYGARMIWPAAIIYVTAIMLLSLCKTYWQTMLVQGVLMGCVMGFLQPTAIAAVSQYFSNKRATALGVAVSGSSIGGIIFPIAISKMLNGSSLGFGWSVRIIAFSTIPFIIFACFFVRPRLPPRTSNFWIPEAYRDKKFLLLVASLFFVYIGMTTPIFYLPTYAVTRGMNHTLAGYLLAMLNGASTFGRIIPGILADKHGRINMYATACFVTGIIVCCMNSAKTTAGLIVYALGFGFASGAIISGASAALSICPPDPRQLGTYLGMGMAISAFGSLIGPPINGAFVNRYGGFAQVSVFSGIMCLLGGVVAVFSKLTTPQGFFGKI